MTVLETQRRAVPLERDQPSTILAAVEATITGRRSVKHFRADPVSRSLVARLIATAVWAPNHRLTEPWRFYVLDGASRMQLGRIAGEITRARLGATAGADPTLIERKAAEAVAAWANVPALLYITARSGDTAEVDQENYGATCCALQNLLLAAHSAGLATSWSSGAVAAADDLRRLVGAGADERMVGLIRIGYPDPAAPAPASWRTPGAQVTTWIDRD